MRPREPKLGAVHREETRVPAPQAHPFLLQGRRAEGQHRPPRSVPPPALAWGPQVECCDQWPAGWRPLNEFTGLGV